MRFLPIIYVKENSILGKHIYDNEGRILLKKGARISSKLKQKIKEIGIHSVYIDDDFSDVELEDMIRPELRNKALSTANNAFNHFQKFNSYITENTTANKFKEKALVDERDKGLQILSKVSEEIMDEILSNRNIVVNLVDIKSTDNYTLQHCINVSVLSLILGAALNLNKNELRNLCLGAILHDIGKTLIPDTILLKDKKLTYDEFEIMKDHTQKGYDYLKESTDITATSRIISLQHHERIDGTGYPRGLKGKEINKLAKIVAIADVYDALTSDRPFRPAMAPNEVIEYIMANGGSHFDFDMVKVFVNKIIPYPVGTLVKLSNGEIAVIEKIIPNFPLRPHVKVITDNNERVIDLMQETSIVITGVQYEEPNM